MGKVGKVPLKIDRGFEMLLAYSLAEDGARG